MEITYAFCIVVFFHKTDVKEINWVGGYELNSFNSGQGMMAGSCEQRFHKRW
jgi:hypothetical protein